MSEAKLKQGLLKSFAVRWCSEYSRTEKLWDKWVVLMLIVLTPLTITAVGLYGIRSFDSTLGEGERKPIHFKAMEGATEGWDATTAMEAVRMSPEVKELATKLSENPFYFLIDGGRLVGIENLYLLSGHAERLSCWDEDGELIGAGDRSGNLDRVLRAGVGFVVPLKNKGEQKSVVCEGKFVGPAQATFYGLSNEQLRGVSDRYHRLFGHLEGGMLMLVIFLLITGVMNREKMYGVFAVWVIANWRLSEQLLGTGADLFTMRLPGSWVVPGALLTIVFFMAANISLFMTLFEEEIREVKGQGWMRAGKALLVLEVLLFVFAPQKIFIFSVWISSGLGVVVMIRLLWMMKPIERGGVPLMYALVLAFALISTLYVVVSEAMAIKGHSGAVFGVVNSLMASVLAILLVASKLQRATASSKALSKQIAERYELTPLGLFEMRLDGKLTSVNAAFKQMFNGSDDDDSWWKARVGETNMALIKKEAMLKRGEVTVSMADEKGVVRHYGLSVSQRDGVIDGAIREKTSEVKAERMREYLIEHDALTGVLNGDGLEKAAEALVAKDSDEVAWVVHIDMERLDSINNMFGHEIGDKVLAEVGARIEKSLPIGSAIGRLGGDEFVAMGKGSKEDGLRAGKICIDAIRSRNIDVDDVSVSLSGWCGVAEWRRDIELGDAWSHAEFACKKGREERERVSGFDGSNGAAMRRRNARSVAERLGVMPGLRDLKVGLIPMVEPSVDGQSMNFEVVPLLRTGEGGFVPDETLMASMELWGSMDLVDVWRMERAFGLLKEMGDSYQGWAAITISGAGISNAVSARRMVTCVQNNIELAHRLVIRVGAKAAMLDKHATQRLSRDLRRYQCQLVLCDAGTEDGSISAMWAIDADGIELSEEIGDKARDGGWEEIKVETVEKACKRLDRWMSASSSRRDGGAVVLRDLGVKYIRAKGEAMAFEAQMRARDMLKELEDRSGMYGG